MACYKIGSETFFSENARDGDGASQDSRLCVGGELELVFGAFKANFGDCKAEGALSASSKIGPGGGIFFGQLFAHAGVLRGLAWKYESYFAHR